MRAKKLLAIICAVCMAVSLCAVPTFASGTTWIENAAASYSTAVDATGKVVTISNAAELALFAKEINTDKKSYSNYTINITENIDLSAYEWNPIAARVGQVNYLFGVTINGNNKTITGIKIRTPQNAATAAGGTAYGVGLIGITAGALTVNNLTFANVDIDVENASQVGTVVGLAYGKPLFNNVDIAGGTIKGRTKVGAILGSTSGDGITYTFTDCDIKNTTVYADYSFAIAVGLEQVKDTVILNNVTAENSSAIHSDDYQDAAFVNSEVCVVNDVQYYIYGGDLWQCGYVNGKYPLTAERETTPATVEVNGVTYNYKENNFQYPIVPTVAKIGTTEYETLATAVANAAAGDTIELLSDVVLDARLDLAKGITIDGKGLYTISAASGVTLMLYRVTYASGTLTFKNLTLDSGNFSKIFQNDGGAGETVFDNVTLENVPTTQQGRGIHISGGGSHATIKNCNFPTNMTSSADYYYSDGLWIGGNTKVYVENSKIGRVFVNNSETTSVAGVAYISGDDTEIGFLSCEDEHLANRTVSSAYISGGHVDTIYNLGNYFISGGTFGTDISAYAALGYEAFETEGVWSVRKAVKAEVAPQIEAEHTEVLTEVAQSVDVVGAIDEAFTQAATELEEQVTVEEGQDVVAYLDVVVEDYVPPVNNAPKKLVVNITPVVKVVERATGNEIAGTKREVAVTTAVTVTLDVPAAFASDGDTIFIVHTKDDGTKYYYNAIVTNGKVSFVNPNGFSVFELADMVWHSDTDAGFYVEAGANKGMMRFLFSCDITEPIIEVGIKYIKGDTLEAPEAATVSASGDISAFYGDILDIPEGEAGNYYAMAYVTTASGTQWSDIALCTPNWTKDYTGYVGGAQ